MSVRLVPSLTLYQFLFHASSDFPFQKYAANAHFIVAL